MLVWEQRISYVLERNVIIDKPTTQQLDNAKEVIEWIVEYTERTEPHAINFINAGRVLMEGMPFDSNDIELSQCKNNTMHVKVNYECSKCGSDKPEHFFNDYGSGVRCLTCGHENEKPKRVNGHDKDQAYRQDKQPWIF